MFSFKSLTHSVLAVAALIISASAAFAAESTQSIGEVISVKQSGYATRLQQSVKHTIKVGDKLYSGDLIDVKSGNVVQIALDADKNNILHIPGDSLVQVSKDRAINLDVSRGRVFALLDKLEPGTKFRVVTPTAISTVRGTYFGVRMLGPATVTSVYRGEVGVAGRLAGGKALGASVPVSEGDKTVVAHAGTRPQKPVAMTKAEFEEINEVIASLGGLKKLVNYNSVVMKKQKADKMMSDEKNLEINKSKDKDSDEDGSSGGKVVF